MSPDIWFQNLGLCVILSPAMLVAANGVASMIERKLVEKVVLRSVQTAIVLGLAAALGVFGLMLVTGERHVMVVSTAWAEIPHLYHFSLKFVFDRLSVPFVILTFVLCGTIGAFAGRYMHREPGFNRFFGLFALFLLGMIVTSLAGTIETLFFGWELVGLSSAMLVAFYHDRAGPVNNGLHVWTVYRISDAALLIAAVTLHHLKGQGDFDHMMGNVSWPDGTSALSPVQALGIGLLLVLAAAGKSALVPFSGWLPRAMEGPTPSSAIFYGSLSVHLGAFLLLRISPLLDVSPPLCAVIVLLGLTTALFGTLVSRVQSDIKSALSFGSLTQVGLIVAEIGLGFRYLALIHILGHACFRTLQFLRAPALLQDYRVLENAIGNRPAASRALWERCIPGAWQSQLYRFSLERGYLDVWHQRLIIGPFVATFRLFDACERHWIGMLNRREARILQQQAPAPRVWEEMV